MAAEETGDANLVSAANYKWVLEKAEKAMTEEFGMMINNMYYHPALIYKAARDLMMKPQAMAALVEDARLSEVPEATSSVLTRLTSLLNGGTCLTNMRVTGNRTHISAPNSFIGNNQVALNIVESWLRNPNVYTKSDVEVIFHLEEKELGYDRVGHAVVDGRADEHDSVAQEARIDVPRALGSSVALDYSRYVIF